MSATFIGGTSYYSRSGSLVGSGSANYTVAMWVKVTTDRNNYSCMFGVDDAGSNYVFIGNTSDGTTFVPDSLASGGINTGVSMTTGTWYYVALTYDATGTPGKAYIAAEGGGSLALTGPHAFTALAGTLTSYIGNNGFNDGLTGEIAYLRVWAAALTSTELEDERVSPTVVRTSNLTAHYKFDSASTTDDSGNGNTLTATGTPGSGTSPSLGSGSNFLLPQLYRGIPGSPYYALGGN